MNGIFSSIANAIRPKTDEKRTCNFCRAEHSASALANNLNICPQCGKYLSLSPRERIGLVADKRSFAEMSKGLRSVDFLRFPGYSDKLQKAEKLCGEGDAVVIGTAKTEGLPYVIFVMDQRFIMASMGSVVGEKLTRAFEYATEEELPVIGFAASGGARMQEGILSLMQMAKVSSAVKKHSEGGNLFISVLTNPTTGGVTASFAMQGDIILAEPGATVGFAGRRVVEQTTKTGLPQNFQSAEFVCDHGFIDRVVPRNELRSTLGSLLRTHSTKFYTGDAI